MKKFFYYYGKEATVDVLSHKFIKSKKEDGNLRELIEYFTNISPPIMPISAEMLKKKYNIPEGKQLGKKLKLIEEEWVKNNFNISNQQVDNIVYD